MDHENKNKLDLKNGVVNEEIQKQDYLKDLVAKNSILLEEIFKQNKKIKFRLSLMIWGNTLKVLLILAPIIFGVVYLTPFIKPLIEQYISLLDMANNINLFNK